MIELGMAAQIRCDSPGCQDKQPGKLVLTGSGGFAVAPQSLAWQLALAPNGVFIARCPEHRVLIQQPTNGAPLLEGVKAEATK